MFCAVVLFPHQFGRSSAGVLVAKGGGTVVGGEGFCCRFFFGILWWGCGAGLKMVVVVGLKMVFGGSFGGGGVAVVGVGWW